jgi:spore germination cell wall hydrolase CwlJ-like protein
MIIAAQQAVAEVIANRLVDPAFPKTALGVVLQPKQFSGTMRGLPIPKGRDIWADALAGLWFPVHVQECLQAWRRVVEATRTGHDTRLVPGALYYYSPVSMVPPLRAPSWVSGLQEVACELIGPDYFRWYR